MFQFYFVAFALPKFCHRSAFRFSLSLFISYAHKHRHTSRKYCRLPRVFLLILSRSLRQKSQIRTRTVATTAIPRRLYDPALLPLLCRYRRRHSCIWETSVFSSTRHGEKISKKSRAWETAFIVTLAPDSLTNINVEAQNHTRCAQTHISSTVSKWMRVKGMQNGKMIMLVGWPGEKMYISNQITNLLHASVCVVHKHIQQSLWWTNFILLWHNIQSSASSNFCVPSLHTAAHFIVAFPVEKLNLSRIPTKIN